MRFDVITLFPQFITQALEFGVVGQAVRSELLTVRTHNPRDLTNDVHHTVDDRPYGGGDGMVLLAEPLARTLDALEMPAGGQRICLSPRGRPFDDRMARELAHESRLILLCGRYGGIDQRLLSAYEFTEISIGDYVLSGGELGALVMIDGIARHLDGVLGNERSARDESFSDGLLEAPLFTRPREFHEMAVPEVLLSGHHLRIAEWRHWLSILITAAVRPDLLLGARVEAKEINGALRLLSSLNASERRACGLAGIDELELRRRLESRAASQLGGPKITDPGLRPARKEAP